MRCGGVGTGIGFGGPPRAYTPAGESGFVASPYSFAALRAAGRLWQDTAMTTPAVANSDPVMRAVCADANGTVYYDAPSNPGRPILTDEGGGKWSIATDGLSQYLRGTVAWPGGTNGFQVTGLVAGLGMNMPPITFNGHDDWFSFSGQNYAYNLRSPRADVLFIFAPAFPCTYSQMSAADYRAYVNGVLKGTTAASWEAPATIDLGRTVAGATYFTGRIAGFSLVASSDQAARARVDAYTTALMV